MSGETWPRRVTDQAVLALGAFGGDITREQAAALLPAWRYFEDLTTADVDEVLARFGPSDVEASR